MYKIRNLEINDYSKYRALIDSYISFDEFVFFISHVLNQRHMILVVVDENTDAVVGTGTLLIEEKLTHGGCRMGHIENILINPDNRSQKLGEKLVKKLLDVAVNNNCYRVDLNCDEKLEKFYNKTGLQKRQQMSMSIFLK